jgi:two-component system, cell cycle sensor histidine kinase and response regulator CckA
MSAAPPPRAADDRRAYETARLRMARMRVAGGDALGEFFAQALKVAADTLSVDRAGVWLFVDERRALRCFDLYERAKDQHSEGVVLHAADFPTYFRALEERRDIPAGEARTDPLTDELREAYLEPLGIVSMLDAPIFCDGQVIGVVCHEHRGAPRQWTAEDRDFAGSVADQVAVKLEAAARGDAEARLRSQETHWLEAHKMEALGRLAAGAAHDFRNVLTVIVGYVAELRREEKVSPRVAVAAREIGAAAERGVALAKELLGFGREEARATRVVDVAEVVESPAGMLRAAAGPSHPVAIFAAPAPGRVFIDRSQLERVVLNLVLNARDAMPDGGTIEVSVLEAAVADGAGTPGVYVVLEVADAGVGMDEATRGRIFEPFFTTKPTGRGTGIGLSVVYRVADRCGGFVHVDSEPGRGTRMRVYLPRVAAES